MINIPELITITAPSNFKIFCGTIKDKSGNEINLNEVGLRFLFADNYGKFYRVVYNPFTEEHVNCYIEQETGKLVLVFNKYDLRDRLKVKTGTFIEDSTFDDGFWDSYDGFDTIKIQIKP